MTQLTANFSLHEMTKSEVALRHGLQNKPGPIEIANLTTLAGEILQPVRNYFRTGVKVNSAFRSLKVNALAGSAKTSHHVLGMAADIEIPGVSNYELAKYISKNFKFTQVILEFYTPGIPDSGWVHVSYDPANLKCQVLTAIKEGDETVYLPGLKA